MITKLVTATLKTTASILLIGGIGLWSSSALAKFPTSENNAQHLEGIIARRTNWSAGVGKRVTDSGLEPINNQTTQVTQKNTISYSGSIETITEDSRSDWDVKSASQNWLNLNRGETSQNIVVRFVVWRF